MFLEVGVTLVDPNKKYLDMRALAGAFPGGGGGFGEWKAVGDRIECHASWVACLGGYYTDLCSEHGLFYRSKTGEVVPFRAVGRIVTDPVTASFYVWLLLKDEPGVGAFVKARLDGDFSEPFSAAFPRADPSTAAIWAELEPLWRELVALHSTSSGSVAALLAAVFDKMPNEDPRTKAIALELAKALDKKETLTRTELNARLGFEIPPPRPPQANLLGPVLRELPAFLRRP